jgi:hypothetical protein
VQADDLLGLSTGAGRLDAAEIEAVDAALRLLLAL